jgi:3-hydroxymyristoyl/3-hydroxydecanoyl-(acyl carrier protein) dehydratase
MVLQGQFSGQPRGARRHFVRDHGPDLLRPPFGKRRRKTPYFTGLDKVRFKAMVHPGDIILTSASF